MSNWTFIIDDNDETYPNEGIDVLVSDNNNHYDVAWFLKSGEYKWVKNDLVNDDLLDFKSFKIIKWKYIE